MRATPALALLLCAGLLPACPSASSRKLNVVLVVMDTARADRCSVNGYARPTTPVLEELAKDAVVYTDAWTPAGWTGPAHASLFTGLRPDHHGFDRGDRRAYLDETHVTLAERFKADGYATGCFTNNPVLMPALGLVRGFDELSALYRDDKRPYPWAPATHEQAMKWVESVHASGKPFFLFVNDMEPHLTYAPPPDVASRFLACNPTAEELATARAIDIPRDLGHLTGKDPVSPRLFQVMSDLYDAEIATLDHEIGVLLDRLRADGLLDSTVVVIVGDHGENLGDHGAMSHVGSLHRSVTQVPLVVRDPRARDRGTRVSSLVRLEDLFPTLLESCGLSPTPGIDGVSLSHDLPGRIARGTIATNPEVGHAAERFYPGADGSIISRGVRSVYDGRMHLLEWSDGAQALYDLEKDPGETLDVSSSNPEALARLRLLLP